MTTIRHTIAAMTILVACGAGLAPAQDIPPVRDAENIDLSIPAPDASAVEPLPLEYRLQRAAERARAGRPLDEVKAKLAESRAQVKDDGLVRIEVHGPSLESPAIDAETFARHGGEQLRSWRHVADGWIPVAELAELARQLPPGYELYSAADLILPSGSATEGNGPGLTNTNVYRDAGYDGSGIKIAVFDMGFRGLMTSVLTDDAPFPHTRIDYTGGDDFFLESDSRHGRFCAEVLYDHAPGAEYFFMKVDTSAGVGAAVDYCIDNDIDIISSSLNFGLLGWNDDSGAFCAAANAAATAGILFFASAGNDGDKHWEGLSLDNDNDDWVNIDPDDETLDLLVQPGKTVEFEVKWDKTGNTNFDIYLFSTNPGDWLAEGTNNGELWEKVTWKNNGNNDVTVHLAIHNGTGATVPIEAFGRGGTWQADLVPWGSTQSPSNCTHPSVLSIGAVPASAYDSPPLTGGIAADYSSRGLSNDGMMLPDLCAPTDISGSFFAVFNGTSAAAPSAAGTAAVLWSANPAATTPQVRNLLFIWSTLKDWGEPGQDPIYGTGGIHFPEYDDCDQNGLVDVFDITAGAPDVNDNWIIDTCETTGYHHQMWALPPEPDDDGIDTILGTYTVPPPGGFPPPAAGLSVGIAHDPAVFAGVDVLPGPALLALNGGLGPDIFLVDVLPQGFTLQTSFGTDPASGGALEIPILETQHMARLRYFTQPGVGAATPPTTLAFTDTLGTAAPVPNQVETTSGPVAVNVPIIPALQFIDPQHFDASLDEATATYDPVDGAVTVTVDASLKEQSGGPAAGTPVTGFTMAIAHDSAAVVPLLVEPAPILAAIDGGTGPSFFSPVIHADGVTVEAIYGVGQELTHPQGLAVVRITYGGTFALIGDLDGEVVHLTFDDGVGGGLVGNTVTTTGGTETPVVGEGWIDLIPIAPEAAFVRGDCNTDGGYDIGDPITVLGYLFPVPGSAPADPVCADACDGNDDGLLDIADAVRLLTGLFGSPTTPPAAPHPGCGSDPTDDTLGCADFPAICP